MKTYKIVVDSEMSLNAKIVDYLPKFNGQDTFESEIDAYKFALLITPAIVKKNDSAKVRVREVTK